MVGMGTVGTGVARLLVEQSARVARAAGRPVELRRVVVRDPRKLRDVSLPAGAVSTDLKSVIDDREIDLVVELIGGINPTREAVLSGRLGRLHTVRATASDQTPPPPEYLPLSGGIFRAVPWLGDDLPRRLPVVAPASRTLVLQEEPALGAVHLALAEARGGARLPTYGE